MIIIVVVADREQGDNAIEEKKEKEGAIR